MTYEELLNIADHDGAVVLEKPLTGSDGRIHRNRIAIRKGIETSKEKSCVLAEELGHYYTTYGNILNQSDTMNRKQELKARFTGYNIKIGLMGIVRAYESGCQNQYEMAEYLDVTEAFLQEALTAYRSKYGICEELDNYIIFFEPQLTVLKKFED